MRLITFGCSLTYGHGLKDCYIPKTGGYPNVPSRYAWPQILADRLGVPCFNRSRPGVSNKFILKSIQDFCFEKNDVVICLWTYSARYTIFKKELPDEGLGPWQDKEISKIYYKHIENDYDSLIDLYTRANWAKNYLDIKGIKNHHMLNLSTELTDQFNWNRIKFLPLHMDLHRVKYPKAEDNRHPNEEAHRDFAIKLEKLLNIRI